MNIDIERKASGLGYRYTVLVDGNAFCRMTTKRVVWPFLRKAAVETIEGENLGTVCQVSLWRKVAEKVPYFYGCPFVLRRGDSEVGWFRAWPNLKQYEARGVVNGIEHRIYGHAGTAYSVYRWPDQIGLINREARSVSDGANYRGEFDGDLDMLLGACLVLFVDLAWHLDDLQFSATSYQWNLQLDGVRQNTDWRPKGTQVAPDEHVARSANQLPSRPTSVGPERVVRLMGWIFGSLSTICLLVALFSFLHVRRFLGTAVHGEGRVVKLVESHDRDSRTTYSPVFVFCDSKEHEHEIHSHTGSYPPAYKVGQQVSVLYSVGEPESAVLDGFFDLWGLPLILGIGAVQMLVALFLLFVYCKCRQGCGWPRKPPPAGSTSRPLLE